MRMRCNKNNDIIVFVDFHLPKKIIEFSYFSRRRQNYLRIKVYVYVASSIGRGKSHRAEEEGRHPVESLGRIYTAYGRRKTVLTNSAPAEMSSYACDCGACVRAERRARVVDHPPNEPPTPRGPCGQKEAKVEARRRFG